VEIDGLIEALRNKDPEVREEAMETLRDMSLGGIRDERVTEALIQALEDEYHEVRWRAANALGEIKDERAIDPLMHALRDANLGVRNQATYALGEMGGLAVQSLIQALGDEYQPVRWRAAEALGYTRDKRAVAPLIQCLKDKSPKVREKAAGALRIVGDERAVAPLIQALKDRNAKVRKEAAGSLVFKGDRKAVEPLIEALEDEDLAVRHAAVVSFRRIRDERAVNSLIKALKDEDWEVCSSAADVLKDMGWKPSNKSEEIAYLIATDNWDELMETVDEEAVEVLVQALKHKNMRVRNKIVEALEKIGWEPSNESEKIDYLVATENWDELVKIGGEKVVEALIQALDDEYFVVREGAAKTLGKIGNEKAVEALIHANLKEKSWHVRYEIAKALEEVGKSTVEHLIKYLGPALNDDKLRIRRKATEVLEILVKADKDIEGS
jgi:HEAT repeat protein